MKSFLFLSLIVLSLPSLTLARTCSKSISKNNYGVNKKLQGRFNRELKNQLKRICCRITKDVGVTGDARHRRSRPQSCHNKNRAIDIVSIRCDDGNNKLSRLAKRLPGKVFYSTFLKCYRGYSNSSCISGHRHHLHFGGREGLRCI